MSAPDSARIEDRIRRVLVEALSLDIGANELRFSDKLDEATGLDSMASLEFLAGLESEFGIVFEPEQMDLTILRDLPKLSAYIGKRLGEQSS